MKMNYFSTIGFILGSLILTGCSTLNNSSIVETKEPLITTTTTTKPLGMLSPYKCDYNPNKSKTGGSFYKTDGPLELPNNLESALEPIPIYEPLHKWANKPYNKLGQDFFPLKDIGTYKEKGVGTWYGRRYHGEKTSNGEIYDMFQMTAASPVLPIPSYAKVTNLKNGRSITVRVNDRGPFLKGRIIDLSFLAACRLGYATQGSTEVEVISILPD